MAVSLTRKLIDGKVIASEEAEIVKYGLVNIGSNMQGLFITLLVGCFFGFLIESFALWLLIFPLRKNAGGFHAETKGRCMLISTGALILSFICFVQIEWSATAHLLVIVLFFIIIFLMAPVGNHNKDLDVVEVRIYRKRTRVILMLQMMLCVLAWYCEWKTLLIIISVSFSIVGVSLIAGKIKLWRQNKGVCMNG